MDKSETIKKMADELITKLIDTYSVEVERDEDIYHVRVSTDEEAPLLIGRHGETIRALQKILEVMLYREFKEPVEILMNVNDYRERQKEKLEELADRFADKAKQTGEQSYVKGLSSYERKIMHEYIAAHYPDLTSYSDGEGRARRLIIERRENVQDEKK